MFVIRRMHDGNDDGAGTPSLFLAEERRERGEREREFRSEGSFDERVPMGVPMRRRALRAYKHRRARVRTLSCRDAVSRAQGLCGSGAAGTPHAHADTALVMGCPPPGVDPEARPGPGARPGASSFRPDVTFVRSFVRSSFRPGFP